jgi:hypothetical protein
MEGQWFGRGKGKVEAEKETKAAEEALGTMRQLRCVDSAVFHAFSSLWLSPLVLAGRTAVVYTL